MNYYRHFDFNKAKELIRLALKEDLGAGDVTTDLLIPAQQTSGADLLCKENGVIAGLRIFKLVFDLVDKNIRASFKVKEGQTVIKNEAIGKLYGNTKSLLLGERLALNILQRMSGIATYTNFLKRKLNDDKIKLIDTRKTTPNFRLFEKLAVRIGGGENHRFGLYDMVLIKDNHISANGGIEKTLKLLKLMKIPKTKIEIEVKNLNEFRKVLVNGRGVIDRVMLDNFPVKDVKEVAVLNKNYFRIEISGGVNEKNIGRYKGIKGIDYISIGALTHSARSLDISLNFYT